MATVNFSVPEDVKREFNELFVDDNKSAVLTGLLRQAIEERRRQQRRARAVEALLDLRRQQQPVADEDIEQALVQARP